MYHYILIIALIILISFIYIYDIRIENMDVKYKCPEKLEINKNGGFTLFENKKYQDIQSLDEYIRIIDWQKKNNINCPILALNMNKTDLAPAEVIPQEEGESCPRGSTRRSRRGRCKKDVRRISFHLVSIFLIRGS